MSEVPLDRVLDIRLEMVKSPVRIYLTIEIILVDRPCAMGARYPCTAGMHLFSTDATPLDAQGSPTRAP